MNALSSSKIRLRAILLHTVYVHVKHRGIARVTVFCYRAKICLLKIRRKNAKFELFAIELMNIH